TPAGGAWSGEGVSDPNGFFNPDLTSGAGTYELIYTYTDPGNNCTNYDTISVEVQEPVVIDAGLNDTLCWDQGLYTLVPVSPSNGRWEGPGIVDEVNGIFDPSIGGGTYQIKYHYGVGSCYVEDFRQIIVVDLSFVSAGQDETACVNAEPILLDDQVPLGGIWSGPGILNGVTGTFDPSQAGPGFHTITYTYTDDFSGCIGSDEKIIEVFPVDPPEFDLPANACVGEPIDFINQSNTLYQALWEFGDGNISNSFNPRHSYSEPNTYSIKLIVETEDGCIDSVRHNIFITERPVPYFEADTTEACVGTEIGITNLSFGYDVSYEWNFGNGQLSTEEDPNIQYFEQGVNDTLYAITLAATNLCGTRYHQDTIRIHPIPVMDFGTSPETECSPVTYSFSNTSIGSPDTYYWDFANGNTFDDRDPDPEAYYTDTLISYYEITLIGTNECGADTARRTVEVVPATVQAFFSTDEIIGCEPFEVEFYNFSTPGARVDWYFGDGNTSTEVDPIHTFNEEGTYEVILYATSSCGYDSTIVEITVLPSPDVSFTHPTYVCQGEAIDFSNFSVNTSGHIWDFGDGDSSILTNPSHVFNTAGTFEVTLTGISAFNQCPTYYTSEVIVRGLPTAAFEPSENNGCMPLEVN
ncbi:MAG: PKD domain-containing protein, partial [Bacteroidota bacterium]